MKIRRNRKELDVLKYDNQECPKCGRTCKTLYRPNWEHPGPNLCYWCNKKRVKEEKNKNNKG